MARSEGRSKLRCGSTRPGGGGGALAGAPALPPVGAPTAGPRSASASRVPVNLPVSIGVAGRLSKVNSPPSRLLPMLKRRASNCHTPASCRRRPSRSKGGVCGSVTPSGAPTRASDGPPNFRAPSSRRAPSSAPARPSNSTRAAPTWPSTRSAMSAGAESLSVSAATNGMAPPVTTASLSGSSFHRPSTRARQPVVLVVTVVVVFGVAGPLVPASLSPPSMVTSRRVASGWSSTTMRPAPTASAPIRGRPPSVSSGGGAASPRATGPTCQVARPSAPRSRCMSSVLASSRAMRSGALPRHQCQTSDQRQPRLRLWPFKRCGAVGPGAAPMVSAATSRLGRPNSFNTKRSSGPPRATGTPASRVSPRSTGARRKGQPRDSATVTKTATTAANAAKQRRTSCQRGRRRRCEIGKGASGRGMGLSLKRQARLEDRCNGLDEVGIGLQPPAGWRR